MFKDDYNFTIRQEKYMAIMKKYPKCVPIVCESGSRGLHHMCRREFSVERTQTLAGVMWRIRRDAKVSETEALFVMVDGVVQPSSVEMGVLYDWAKDEDGWLYITYVKENTFGEEVEEVKKA
ncbi:uncharacterized protein H6S33_006141 [Morchella sextelata]|jgi:GABA(A) receptor-associated protein|uniref:uncharacterized protein n=1 Tax=Morchella sextelata TaxID=1174677 RepID=UPI001D047AF0|nr:uncharacterized protein H6S33_006141 [Morchella sextelata]KAH0614255.1 hypothetical protein H6S33_006141 [Morchella sextelata]